MDFPLLFPAVLIVCFLSLSSRHLVYFFFGGGGWGCQQRKVFSQHRRRRRRRGFFFFSTGWQRISAAATMMDAQSLFVVSDNNTESVNRAGMDFIWPDKDFLGKGSHSNSPRSIRTSAATASLGSIADKETSPLARRSGRAAKKIWTNFIPWSNYISTHHACLPMELLWTGGVCESASYTE